MRIALRYNTSLRKLFSNVIFNLELCVRIYIYTSSVFESPKGSSLCYNCFVARCLKVQTFMQWICGASRNNKNMLRRRCVKNILAYTRMSRKMKPQLSANTFVDPTPNQSCYNNLYFNYCRSSERLLIPMILEWYWIRPIPTVRSVPGMARYWHEEIALIFSIPPDISQCIFTRI